MSHSDSDDDDASSFEMISSSPITGHHQLQHDESRLSKGYISVPNPLLNLSPDGGQKHEKVDVGTSGGDSFSGSDFSDEWDHVLDPTQCCINCDDDEHDETENVKAKRSLVVLSKIDASTPQQAAQDSSPDKSTRKTITGPSSSDRACPSNEAKNDEKIRRQKREARRRLLSKSISQNRTEKPKRRFRATGSTGYSAETKANGEIAQYSCDICDWKYEDAQSLERHYSSRTHRRRLLRSKERERILRTQQNIGTATATAITSDKVVPQEKKSKSDPPGIYPVNCEPHRKIDTCHPINDPAVTSSEPLPVNEKMPPSTASSQDVLSRNQLDTPNTGDYSSPTSDSHHVLETESKMILSGPRSTGVRETSMKSSAQDSANCLNSKSYEEATYASSPIESDKDSDAHAHCNEATGESQGDQDDKLGLEDSFVKAASNGRLLLVYIQNYPLCFGSFTTSKDVLSDSLIQELIQTSYIFYQTMKNTRDAKYYIDYFHVKQFPYLAILDPTTRSVIWKIQGWAANDSDNKNNSWTTDRVVEVMTDTLFKYEDDKVNNRGKKKDDESDTNMTSRATTFSIDRPVTLADEYSLQRAIFSLEDDKDKKRDGRGCLGGEQVGGDNDNNRTTIPNDETEFYELQMALMQTIISSSPPPPTS